MRSSPMPPWRSPPGWVADRQPRAIGASRRKLSRAVSIMTAFPSRWQEAERIAGRADKDAIPGKFAAILSAALVAAAGGPGLADDDEQRQNKTLHGRYCPKREISSRWPQRVATAGGPNGWLWPSFAVSRSTHRGCGPTRERPVRPERGSAAVAAPGARSARPGVGRRPRRRDPPAGARW